MNNYHQPVLLHDSINALNIDKNGIYVDVTFGGGGHSREILKHLDKGRLIAFDQDADAHENKIDDERFYLVPFNFRHLKNQLEKVNAIPADGLLADLGVSSHQFDEADRGFSIRFNAVLDMRMDQNTSLTAADILNRYSEEDLASVFHNYGELTGSRRLAKLITDYRSKKKFETAADLKEAVASMVPAAKENTFYAKLFQALRIEVNDEMNALKELLEQVPFVLRSGGRMVVISYHSLEDRLIKNFINTGNVEGEQKKDLFGNITGKVFRSLTKKPVEASEEEIRNNPRSRSAKMRIAEKI